MTVKSTRDENNCKSLLNTSSYEMSKVERLSYFYISNIACGDIDDSLQDEMMLDILDAKAG